MDAIAFVLTVLSLIVVGYAWLGVHTERRFLGLLLTALWLLLLIGHVPEFPH